MRHLIFILFLFLYYQFSFSQDLIWAKKNGLWGAINYQGELIVEHKYESWKPIFENPIQYAVLEEGKWGMISEEGRERIEPQYEDIRWYSYQGDIARIIVGGTTHRQYDNQRRDFKEGVINANGETIIPAIYEVINYYHGFFSVGKGVPNRTDNSYSSGGKWGLLDSLGQIVVPVEYNYCHTDGKVIHAAKGAKRYVFSLEGKSDILQSEYENFIPLPSTNYIQVYKKRKYGLVHLDGSEAIPIKYEDIKYKDNSDTFLVKKNGFWGVYRLGRGEVISTKYKQLKNCGAGIVHIPEKGFWNINSGIFVTHNWLHVSDFEGGFAIARKSTKLPFYIIDDKNNIIKNTPYLNGYFRGGYWFLRVDYKHWEVLDISTGKFSRPFYDERNYSSNPKDLNGGLLSGRKIWIKGNNVVTSDSEIKGTPYGIITTENKKEKFYSLKGELILSKPYKKIIPINNKVIAVKNELDEVEFRNYSDEKIKGKIKNISSLVRQKNGLCIINKTKSKTDVFQGQKIRYGVVNDQADIILEPIYIEIKILPKGGFAVKDENENVSHPWKILYSDGTEMSGERFEKIRF